MTLKALVLAFMQMLVPESEHYWTREEPYWVHARYEEIAQGITNVAVTEEPLPELDQERTALVLANIGARESYFRKDIVDCTTRGMGGARGLFQVENPRYHYAACLSIESSTRLALKMARESFIACSKRPLVDRLSFYTDGPIGCPAPWARSRARLVPALRVLIFTEGSS